MTIYLKTFELLGWLILEPPQKTQRKRLSTSKAFTFTTKVSRLHSIQLPIVPKNLHCTKSQPKQIAHKMPKKVAQKLSKLLEVQKVNEVNKF